LKVSTTENQLWWGSEYKKTGGFANTRASRK
jgi:hypothetical protein